LAWHGRDPHDRHDAVTSGPTSVPHVLVGGGALVVGGVVAPAPHALGDEGAGTQTVACIPSTVVTALQVSSALRHAAPSPPSASQGVTQ